MARSHVERGGGGPFAAAIFESSSGRLVAAGVNRVVRIGSSMAHAEVVAILMAQKVMGSHDLGGAGLPEMELVSSAEPCAMCQGAVAWSGVRSLVCGARGCDVTAIGFDEGVKARDWVRQFKSRGIAVVRDVCRRESVAVLKLYRERGGLVYNARQGRSGVKPENKAVKNSARVFG